MARELYTKRIALLLSSYAVLVLLLALSLLSPRNSAEAGIANLPAAPPRCLVTFKLSQSHFSLDLSDHIKDAMNSTEVTLPIDCREADMLRPGTDILNGRFRTGSLIVRGSIGRWHMTVIRKEQR